jgi:pyruvate/2-oxoglutarate dehydrogenase complex dihydrolipoamide acyltransferase (E2) component
MAKDVIMPALGMAQESGVLVRWLVPEGGKVAEGDPLMEVETDKAVVEVPATASGTLAAVAYGEGADVAVGTVLAVLLAPGESAGEVGSASAAASGADTAAASAAARDVQLQATLQLPVRSEQTEVLDTKASFATADAPVPGSGSQAVLASPKAKRLARERGLDLALVAGSGPNGAVRAVDLPAMGTTQPRVLAGSREQSAPDLNLQPGTPPAASGIESGAVAWLQTTVDAAGLSEFLGRARRSLESGLAPTVAPGSGLPLGVVDVLTRVVVVGLSHDPVLADYEPSVDLSVYGSDVAPVSWRLAGSQLDSVLNVLAARRVPVDAAATGASRERTHNAPYGPALVAIVDRSSERFERSPVPLSADVGVRLTLGPITEAVTVRDGAPVVHTSASLRLDYRTTVLDDTRATALVTYVSRLLGDPFALAVHG